jgi:hypothetical protein
LKKLTRFVRDAGYERAIYLIYGIEAEQMIEPVFEIAKSIRDLAPIELWLHQLVGRPAEHPTTIEMREGS